jgi:hypothetical protein
MKKVMLMAPLVLAAMQAFSWGFYAHKLVNYYAVFLLPPEMVVLYKPNILFISAHAVDPDKRRYAVKEEGARHYIDLDTYGRYPYDGLPRKWPDAVKKYSEDTLKAHGILPWHIQVMLKRLTKAFGERDKAKILKLSAELGHYVADSHVPLHASSNHNGQLTNQRGIHGFWESRIPELLAESEWSFFAGKAVYVSRPLEYCWKKVLESGRQADTVLRYEKNLNDRFPADAKYAFENRNGAIVKQYSEAYTRAYNRVLAGMVERRLVESIHDIACMWYTAWVDAGQPDLRQLAGDETTAEEEREFEDLNKKWREGRISGKSCE